MPTKVCLVKAMVFRLRPYHPECTRSRLISKAMVFPVVMCGCESWTIKKVERRRIDAFELWCSRRLLRVSWTARRSNQSILKEISTESLEGLMLKLKLKYFGYLMWRNDSGKDWRQEKGTSGWDGWMALLTWWTWISASSRSCWWTGKPGMLQSMGLQRVRHNWASELNWYPSCTSMTKRNSYCSLKMGLHK